MIEYAGKKEKEADHMPNRKSTKDRVKRNEKENLQNKIYRNTYKNLVKKITKAVDAGDKETAVALLPEAFSAIDRTAKVGAFHKNQAARRKSRLTKKVNFLVNSDA